MVEICQTCGGTGELSWETYDAPSLKKDFGTVSFSSVDCPACKGTGEVIDDIDQLIEKYIDTDYDPDE